jgi:tetratricopeptide (TPR) repeat protein
MNMKRIILFALCMPALLLEAQSLSGQAEKPIVNELGKPGSELNIGIEKVSGRSSVQPINITSNMIGQLSRAEPLPAADTNQVKTEKAGFFLSTGLEYADEGEYEEAERAYQRALEAEPDREDILFRLGTLYVSMERYADAVDIFSRLVEKNPENPLSHNNLAWCYATGAGVRNVTLALRHSREALLFAPLEPSMWNTLAEAYYLAGDYSKALRSSDRALELLQALKTPPEETLRSFQLQHSKILRARQASEMLEGLDSGD